MDKIREYIARNIEWYRKKAGRTQVEVAKLAGVALRSLQRAEDPDEQGNIEVSTLLAIASAIDVHPSKLMLEPGTAMPISTEEALEIVKNAALASQKVVKLPVSGDSEFVEKLQAIVRDAHPSDIPAILKAADAAALSAISKRKKDDLSKPAAGGRGDRDRPE